MAVYASALLSAVAPAACASAQQGTSAVGVAPGGECPVPPSTTDTAGWPTFSARNAPFIIRLPPGAREEQVAEDARSTQTWVSGSVKPSLSVVHVTKTTPPFALDPYDDPAGPGRMRQQHITRGPCREFIGGREATIWMGEWVNRGIFSAFPYQVVVAWDLEPGHKLFVLAQSSEERGHQSALAALRSIRFRSPE
jgi:hypothetical protein